MANYERGDEKQIIVGAAALFVTKTAGNISDADLPAAVANVTYRETLSDPAGDFRNVGYTSNGLELQFQPDFGEVRVDQVLDVAKLYKQGMQVNLNTSFAEATLENLLFSLAGKDADKDALEAYEANTALQTWTNSLDGFEGDLAMNMSAGDIGECPVERGLVAVGPGTGDCEAGSSIERIYVAYRALSIENVTVSAKRDEASMFDVSFRLLPSNLGSYGKIIDRTLAAPTP